MPPHFAGHGLYSLGAEIDIIDHSSFQQGGAEVHFTLLKAKDALFKIHKEEFAPDDEILAEQVHVSPELELLRLQVSLYEVGADAVTSEFKRDVGAFQGVRGCLQVFKLEDAEGSFRFSCGERWGQTRVSGGVEGKPGRVQGVLGRQGWRQKAEGEQEEAGEAHSDCHRARTPATQNKTFGSHAPAMGGMRFKRADRTWAVRSHRL